ncbi:hypothetical protein [Tannerella forsythia]|uniref:hypothetical protein n=1 Tax=Tannerella forsythia TaxID=28112 RepID=UPI000764B77D|nr:hypothetical protein [Tannerella forsythia]
MKKILFAIASVAMMLMIGCKKDELSEPIKPIQKEEKNRAPAITSIDFEKSTFALNQVAIVKATVTDPENDDIDFSWSSGGVNIGNEQELKVRFSSIGERDFTLKVTDSKGNKAEKSLKINVVKPDFGFALWGDKLDIIQRSDTGLYLGNNASVIYHFLGDGYDRYYTFNKGMLVSGIQERIYTPKVLHPTQYAIAWILYEEELKKLTDRFGKPNSLIFSTQITGDKSKDGLSLINGSGIEAKFSSSRTNVTLTVYRKGRTTVCYRTNFSTKM